MIPRGEDRRQQVRRAEDHYEAMLREARLVEAGNRLANVVANSVPERYLDLPSVANALTQWDDVAGLEVDA